VSAEPPGVGAGMWPYVLFTGAVGGVLALDLGLAARRPGAVTLRAALLWTGVWVGLALAFAGWLAQARGAESALAYLAAYLTEESLSLDNVMVFAAIFAYFGVPRAYEHRVLFWGVVGAIALRGAFIALGVELFARVSWIGYVFGALLLVGGLRMLRRRAEGEGERGGALLRVVRRVVPVTEECRDAAFFRWTGRGLAVTPLFVTLVVVELSDVIFAADSLPAVFGVTRDPFLVYTSNILAVLGLRSLYFLVAGVLPRLRYLRYGLAAILAFIGAKMLAADVVEVPVGVSLAVVAAALALTAAASLLPPRRSPDARSSIAR
jgi:tellurite resistance protein TerC